MKKQRGSAFIMALVVIAVLAAVLATAAADSRVSQISQRHRINDRRAERMAIAAIDFSIAQMLEIDTNTVTLDDDWALIGEGGTQDIYVGNGCFRVQVIDAGSKIDLNHVNQDQLEQLPLTSAQIDSLLDWREPDLQPRIEGAKDEYYNTLWVPYNVKLRNFDTVSELLLVRGFDPQTVYEPFEDTSGTALTTGNVDDVPPLYEMLTVDARSSNLAASGQQKTNINSASTQQMTQAGITNTVAQAIVQRRNTQGTFTSWSQVVAVTGVTMQNVGTLLDNLTLDTGESVTGRVNLNTATEITLNLLPGMTPDVTEAIISRQGTLNSIGEIAGVPGLSLGMIGQIAGMITVSSEAFLLRILGCYQDSQIAYEVVVTIEEGTPTVRRIEKSPFFDAPLRWGWAAESDTESQLVGTQ